MGIQLIFILFKIKNFCKLPLHSAEDKSKANSTEFRSQSNRQKTRVHAKSMAKNTLVIHNTNPQDGNRIISQREGRGDKNEMGSEKTHAKHERSTQPNIFRIINERHQSQLDIRIDLDYAYGQMKLASKTSKYFNFAIMAEQIN